jgi:hypothetical protein
MLEFGDFNTTYISVHEASCIALHFTNILRFKKQCGERGKASILLENVQMFLALKKKPFAQN